MSTEARPGVRAPLYAPAVDDWNGSGWGHERCCAAVEAEVARFVTVIGDADPATPVPTCPGWTVADLVRHHGTTHRWVEHIVRTRASERVWSRDVVTDAPDDDRDLAAWLAAGAERLLVTLRAAGPDLPVWSWGADQHARFWSRRVLYEAVIHRADAELALGRVPHIDRDTAVEGIEEFLTNLPNARWVAERLEELLGNGHTVHLHATDAGAGGEWMISLPPDGVAWKRGHGKATVAVQAQAGDLLLLIYGRLRPAGERFAVFGDQLLLERWLEKSSF